MTKTKTKVNVAVADPVWQHIREEARAAVLSEPLLGGFFHSGLLHHATLEKALSYPAQEQVARAVEMGAELHALLAVLRRNASAV